MLFGIIRQMLPSRANAHELIVAALIEARHKRRLSQADAAAKLGRSQTWLARFELNEKKSVDIVDFIVLCRLYRLDPHKLFYDVTVAIASA